MKGRYLLFFCLLSCLLSAQNKFDCNNLSKQDFLYRYSQLKEYGIDYKFENKKEVIPFLIAEIFDNNSLRQLCIDAAYDNYQLGTEKQYKLYNLAIKNISKENFYQNVDFLMIFLKMVTKLEQNTNYKRHR